MKASFCQGPQVVLQKKEIEQIKEKGHVDFDFYNIKGVLRVSITDRTKSQLQGLMCEPGINVRRYPEGICPYDYEGNQLWVVRLSRDKFQEFLDSEPDFSGMRHMMSRCKYDRMYLGYFSV